MGKNVKLLYYKLLYKTNNDPNASFNIKLSLNRNYVAAESALDRMCCGLGGKIMLGLIVGQVPEMLSSGDWKRRHAALMAVSSAGEGCHKLMEQMLDQVVSAVLNYLTDPVSYLLFTKYIFCE